MILTKILFIILIIVCICFYVLYVWDFALILLIVIAALPVIMFITTYITKKLITVEFAVKDKNVSKGKDFPVQLVVTNRSIFPIGKAEAHIEYYNVFSDQISAFDLYLPIQPKNSQRITFQLSSKFCGVIKIRSARLNIYDPLRLFRFRTAKNICTDIAVMPEGHEIGGIVHYTDRVNEESDVFSEYKPGDDPSEVFDLREYNQGDKLNRIHWKLSSKKDDFIVKDYSLPIDVPCSVFLDLKCYEKSDLTLPVFDTLIETMISLSQFLLENERGHSIIFFNSSLNRFVEHTVLDSADLNSVINEIISSVRDDLFCQSPDVYFAENPTLSYASFSIITSSKDHRVLEHIDENIEADFKNALLVVNSADDLSETLAGYQALSIIPVAVGKISASIKDIDI
ncbi:MAG: DUF58 domain-containing protein [Ruminococcus sp.]|uniref:DUF58 domain-containing protein n=1 Tax=Ruminococcus sp. TaxID=41978 RepID=UPI0025E30DA1|nr:DUF58 domain-containing protein [Ruminococcus sp.]MBR3666199.1 DUF58 domain-containing protein [Ruminococcus sp.]MBR6995985.1 DUF58 domain-containing protein [Ruminococcus sp.]